MLESQDPPQEKATESLEQSIEHLRKERIQERPGMIDIAQMEQTQEMLVGFREAVKEARCTGKNAMFFAQGLLFLENMIAQGKAQIAMARTAERKAKNEAVPN